LQAINKTLDYKEKIILLLLLIIAAIIRLFWVIVVENSLQSDFKTYYEIAVALYKGENHFFIGYQGIGYPLFLSLIFRMVGYDSVILAKFINVIISTLTILFVFLTTYNWFKSKIFSFVITSILIILPNYIAYTNVLGTEVLFTFFFSIILFLQTIEIRWKWVLLGIFIGLAALTRPIFLAYPILVLILSFLKKEKLKEALKPFLIVVIFMGFTILPWTIRNYIVLNAFIPVSYNGAYVLYINNNSQNTHGGYMPIENVEPTESLLRELSELKIPYGQIDVRASSAYQKAAVNWIINNPKKFIELGIKRLKSTYFGGSWDMQQWSMDIFNQKLLDKVGWNIYQSIMKKFSYITNGLLYFLAITSIFFILIQIIKLFKNKFDCRKNYCEIVIIFNIFFFSLIYFIYEGQPRYNFPTLFLQVIMSMLLIRQIILLIKEKLKNMIIG